MTSPQEELFLQAFDDHADALYRHAYFRLGTAERATDITQDTYLKAWDYLKSGKEVREWKAFLYRVLNNLIIDEYRKKREQSLDALMEDASAEESLHLATGSRAEKEESFDEELLIQRVRSRITELPADQQAVLTLRYVDGLSPKEIARTLSITENTASVRIHRALERLKKLCAPLTL